MIAILLAFFTLNIISGQGDTSRNKVDSLPDKFYVIQKVDRNGENLPEIEIKEISIYGEMKPASRFQAWRYERTIYNVKRVYPYSKIVRERLDRVNEDLKKITDEKERREYIKSFEKDVFRDYEDDMRHMTITQGRILIKLIDRETENTSYELIKEYRGNISAAFWQGIARIFGSNLKSEYDPEGDDYLIERIIYEIEMGRL